MSRLIPHGQFYLTEGLDSYLDCLRQALLRRGLPRRLYVDNGAAFRSQHLTQITASLGIALIHSAPYQPEDEANASAGFERSAKGFFPMAGARVSRVNPSLLDLGRTELPSGTPFGHGPDSLGAIFSPRILECLRPPQPISKISSVNAPCES